jgi:hypothetical protein
MGLDAEAMLLGGFDRELPEARELVGTGGSTDSDGLLDLFEGNAADLGGQRRILRCSLPLEQNHGQEGDLPHRHLRSSEDSTHKIY